MPAHATVWLATLVVALVAALALGGWALWRRRRVTARVLKREPKPVYPVVLAHGLFGFDEIALGGTRHQYFRGVPTRLEKSGHIVHAAKVATAAGVETRAEELARFITEVDAKRVNIVAHSMGGLDARYAIARLGLAPRVASLVTLGTPHRGTPIAALGSGLARRGVVKLLGSAGLDVSAIDDLTPARLARFNDEVPAARGVHYASVVGVSRKKRRMNPLLVPTHLYLREVAGENDGMVPAESQRWGEVLAEVEADHWAQIGWSKHFDAAELYAWILRELRGRGF
ncbi:MAG: hypothetical protein JST54_35080 [Deltaproteobacteria bacterium]|nr:hypothetical protein [Deltaproteobacteria bacterium]